MKDLLAFFNYVTFPNAICQGTGDIDGRSGVCWTKEECAALNGIADGGCASGYGVCCIFMPSCGATVTQNLTYLIQDATTNPTTKVCAYTLCPVSESVNRIRLDFTTFDIADPAVATAGSTTSGSAAGDCATDSFSVSAGGGGRSSPIICGANTGQHVIVDTDGASCVTASFVFGGDSTEREYDIRVLQYEADNEMGGPPGCLQFLLGTVAAPHGGTITSFNWVNPQGAHLSNQNYDVCIRRAAGQCAICWASSITQVVADTVAGSFGLSTSVDGTADDSVVGTQCTTDYVVIPNGEAPATALQDVNAGLTALTTLQTPIAIGNGGRFCGRNLHPQTAMDNSGTVCSRVFPFKLSVVTDADEEQNAVPTTANNEATATINAATGSFGTAGFSLGFRQIPCA